MNAEQPRSYFITESWPSKGSVDTSALKVKDRLDDESFSIVHRNSIIPCHDAFIEYQLEGKTGILFAKRTRTPLKNLWWTFGGKRYRGLAPVESLRQKIREESGLELKDITYLGWADTIMEGDPLGHGRGTHTTDLQYFARGIGKLELDRTHSNVIVVSPKDYNENFNSILHPRIKDFLELIPEYQP